MERPNTESGLCAGFLMPHPPIILSEIGKGREHEASATISACYRVASRVAELKPEIVVVISPHAPLFSDFLFMYDRPVLGGSFARFGEPALRYSFSGEHGFVEEFRLRLQAAGIAGGVPSGDVIAAHDIDMDLDHGVLVPLSFVSGEYRDFGLVAISSAAFDSDTTLLAGRVLADVAKASGRRVCLIASGDMSHRVNAQSPYGMVRAGAEFDAKIADSIGNSTPGLILSIDPALREKAAECGYNSILMLLGAFGASIDAAMEAAQGRAFAGSVLYSYEAPFGIGYCVAEFTPGYPKES